MKRMFCSIICLGALLSVHCLSVAAQDARQLLNQAQQGEPRAIAELFNAYVDERRRQDWTQLHWAAYRGDEEIAQLFLDSNIAIDQYGWTPLHVAAREGHVHIVQYLLRHGAAINSEDLTGHTAITLAANANHEEVVRSLLEHGAEPTADMLSDDAQLLVARVLVSMANEVADQPEEQSLNAEQKAIVHAGLSDAQIIELIEGQDDRKCPITAEDLDVTRLDQVAVLSNGCVAVHISAIKGIIDSGRTPRDPYTSARLSQALLDYVRAHGRAQQNDEALDDDENNNHVRDWLNQELINAVMNNDRTVVEQLLAQGAQINGGPRRGIPLVWAIIDNNEEMVRMLLAAGADATMVDGNGRSMLALARLGRNQAIIDLIIQR